MSNIKCPAKWRKKPVAIDAIQYNGDNDQQILSWVGYKAQIDPDDNIIRIHTLEGNMAVDIGDWVIRGVKGEFYPCKSDIFALTYDPIIDTPAEPLAKAIEEIIKTIQYLLASQPMAVLQEDYDKLNKAYVDLLTDIKPPQSLDVEGLIKDLTKYNYIHQLKNKTEYVELSCLIARHMKACQCEDKDKWAKYQAKEIRDCQEEITKLQTEIDRLTKENEEMKADLYG